MPNGYTKPRILMVADRVPGEPLGSISAFGISYSLARDPTDLYYFSMSHLLGALDADITKAHRQTDPAADNGGPTPADIENFRFTGASLAGVNQVWLIGYNCTRLDTPGLSADEIASVPDHSELAALATFMDGGGGVYAVGDHGGLGLSLCGGIPRVRTMRKWWYPVTGPFGNEPVAPPALSGITASRLDSTRPGHTPATDPHAPSAAAVWFDDQSDDVPQYLSPNGQGNLCVDPRVYLYNPGLLHPLLQGPQGPILAFADHMHEGEVILPYEYDRIFKFGGHKFTEYPAGVSGQVKPQIIAWSWTNGAVNVVPASEIPNHTGDDSISEYRQYGAIGAYDGAAAGVGRVVVESTFHHFMDINLIGDLLAPPGDPKQQGFRYSPQGQAILANIDAYYNNVAQWLTPPPKMKIHWIQGAIRALEDRTLREIATNPPPGARLRIGEAAVSALAPSVRPGMLVAQLASVLPEEVRRVLPAMPWGPVTGTSGCGSLDYTQFLHAGLGEAVLVAAALARGRGGAALLHDRGAQRAIADGTVRGVSALASDLERRGHGLVRLAGALRGAEPGPAR